MSDSKVYMFPETQNSWMPLISSLMQQKGIDPNILLARNNGCFGNEGGWFMWIIFLFFLMGWGGNGWNGFGNRGNLAGDAALGNLINNDNGRELLMSAIQGNGNAINQLASTVNCDINSVKGAINAVMSQIQNVGNQVGMSGMQIINAIQGGNQQIASQLAQCCCHNKQLTITQGYESQIRTLEQTNQLGSQMDVNTSILSKAIADQTTQMQHEFCALKERELQNKIDSLTAMNSSLQNSISNANQTSQIQAYIASVVNPLAADVASIKAAQPSTVAVQWPNITAVPSYVANGYYGATSIWS